MAHRSALRSSLTALTLLTIIGVRAQLNPLTLSTTVNPPYTASYVQYFQNPQQISVLIHNDLPGAVAHDIYLAGSISTMDGSISVTIEGGQPWNAPPLNVPVGFTAISGTDLQPFVSNAGGQLQYTGITEEDIRLGLLPEGEYQICLQAFDYFTNAPLSAGAPSDGCSNVFTVAYPPPPQLLAPACDQMVQGAQPQSLLFNWILPSGPPMGANMQYHFKLVLLTEENAIDPLSALQSSNDPVWEDDVLNAQVLYTQLMPALLTGRRYAWYVRAVDVSGVHVFQNDGWSEPCTFTWSGDAGFSFAFPVVGDTLPWDFLPIVARFDPYRDDITQFNSELTLIHVGGEQATYQREVIWADGPRESQEDVLGTPVTEDQARHINVYKRPGEEGVMYFESGEEHVMNAQITLSPDNGDPISGYIDGGFATGMGTPRMLSPAHQAVLPRNGGNPEETGFAAVPLRFKTAEPPVSLLPPFAIIQNVDGLSTQTDGRIYQRWRIDVSRTADFNQTEATHSERVGSTLSLLNGSCDLPCMLAELYKEITFDFTPNAEGTYYWRIVWVIDHNNEFSAHYRAGPTYSFSIGEPEDGEGGGGGTAEEEEIPAAECLAESRRAPTPILERNAVNTTQVGDTVQVGKFHMRITSILHGAGNMASGEGLISVPVMDALLRVRFSQALINANKRLYQGEVNALYDNEGVIQPAFIQGGSLAAGFSPQAAQALDDYLNTAGRLISQFSGAAPMGLPLGVDKEVPGIGRVVIGILGMQFTDTIARMNAGMSLPVHELGTSLSLGNMAMPFHPGGFGDLTEEATLYLLSDLDIDLGDDTLKFKGARFSDGFTTVQDSGTFVAWDCNGFRAVTFDAEYRFSREKLREDLANGDDGPRKVIGALRVRTGRGGLMGRMDMNTAFHLNEAKSWGFDVQEAWLDLASYTNPPDMQLPPAHFLASAHMQEDGTVDPAWTGVYVERTMLRLPPTIERFQGTGRVTAQVDDFIYEFGTGVSAQFKVANILDANEGNLDGWGFSLDTLQMDIVVNTFSQGGFKGRIKMPFTDTLLVYTGMIQHDPQTEDVRMEFLLHPDGTLNVPMYVAHAELYETSTVRAIFGDASTGNSARAELNGKLSIDVNAPAQLKINFRDIGFQQLYFQTNDPYTNVDQSGVFSLVSPQKFLADDSPELDDEEDSSGGSSGGFPVSITRVTTERRNSEGGVMAGIGFDINLDLSGQTNIFVATTRIAVLGQLNTTAIHQWGHHSIELDSIGVTGETGAVKIIGGLRWYHDDPVYGNGINGLVNAWFMKGALQVRAAAQFGTVNSMRYWYADAMFAKEGGFSPGQPFNVYGFGGGAWYHMRRTTDLPSAQQVTQATIAAQDDDEYTPGLTLTSIRFVPDAAISFGFQATVIFGDGASGRAYNGDLTAGMSFSESGGVNTAFLNGTVYMMSDRNDRTYVPIRGSAEITFDFPNDVFQANFAMKVTIGSGLVTGTGPDDLAGAAELLITPDTWHLFVGTPQTPVGLDFLGLFSTTSYFMVGKGLPDPLPPDSAAVLALLGNTDFNWPAGVDEANGIAFGARGALDQQFDFYLLRMHLQAGLGFDMAFVSAANMTCEGIADPGIAGFYATGQVFAYLGGSVSLHVDVWFAEGDFEIMNIAAAALLQGGFADPNWVRGEVGGRYSILGGMIDGSFNFPFSAGHPCDDFGAGALAGLDPIGDITPRHNDGITPGSTPVDVGANCEVALNMKLDTPFNMKEYRSNGSSYWRTFRLVLDGVSLKKSGTEQQTTQSIAPSKDQVLVIPSRYLDPLTRYTFNVRLRAEERNSEGVWATAITQGEQAIWDTTVTFKTGEGLKEIREQDLLYTYPFIGQRYVLQDECRSAIIHCKADLSGQDAIFGQAVAGRVRIYKMMLTPLAGGPTITCPIAPYLDENTPTTLSFALPQLLNSKTYVAQVIYRDSLVQSGTGPQAYIPLADLGMMSTASSSTSTTSQQGHTFHLRQRRLTGYSVRPNEKLLFTYYFRTSAHNTIAAKAAALTNNTTFLESDGATPPRETLRPDLQGESFDVFDVNGYTSPQNTSFVLPPLISLSDALTDAWSVQWSDPVLYDYYAEIEARNCSSIDLMRSVTYSAFGVPRYSDTPSAPGIPPFQTVKWRVGNPTRQPLTPDETVPLPANGLVAQNTNNLAVSAGASTASVRLDHTTAIVVRNDHQRLLTITADVIANCGPLQAPPPPAEYFGLMPEPLRSMVIRFQNSGFKRAYRGNYRVRFSFHPPPTCMPFTDWNQQAAVSYGEAVFNHTLGPVAPVSHSPLSPPGSGVMQTAP